MSRRRYRVGVAIGIAVTLALVITLLTGSKTPPREPSYQGMTLRQWIRAEPKISVISHEDIIGYRRTALKAMGKPAVQYLHQMITHPRQMLEGHTTWIDRLRPRLPQRIQRLLGSPKESDARFANAIVALQLIGTDARTVAPDLVRLWESNGNSDYESYNGFPLALAELGDTSPKILAALHRHFNSPDRLHRALCAFAAWRLKSDDADAIALLHRELSSTGAQDDARYALLDTFPRYSTNAGPFAAELRNLIAVSETGEGWQQTTTAKAAWKLFSTADPAQQVIQRLAGATRRPEATAREANEFAASALELAEIPGVRELAVPRLKELRFHSDASVASFVSAIVARVDVPSTNALESPQSTTK